MKNKIIIIMLLIIIIMFLVTIKHSFLNETNKIKTNQIATENSTITGLNYKYNNPIIPKGFKAVPAGASWEVKDGIVKGWDKGLVIEDEQGNQFVWVPVKDGINKDGLYNQNDTSTVEYKKWYIYKEEKQEEILENDIDYIENLIGEKIESTLISYEDFQEDKLPEGVEKEENQIKKYGGFYIARYEAALSDDTLKQIYNVEDNYNFIQVDERNNQANYKPISKENSQIWNFIEYENAKTVSENMYKTNEVKSGLMTGKQFDTIIRWAKVTGYDFEDPRSWGNFFDTKEEEYTGRYASYLRKKSQDWKIKDYGIKQKENKIFTGTGGLKNANMNQIYDIAGNVFELTTDLYKGKIATVRGGSAAYEGRAKITVHPIEGYSFGDDLSYAIGFRVVLYIL